MISADKIPHFLKYMGSKRDILDDICGAVESLNIETDYFCDLFAGTGIVAYAMSDRYNVIANDIQQYTSILVNAYFGNYQNRFNSQELLQEIYKTALAHISKIESAYPVLKEIATYSEDIAYDAFVEQEHRQQQLIHMNPSEDYTLFTRCYSGTYWSLEQCKWIDGLRKVADDYRESDLYYGILASLIYAMSYSSQSTGHFAQFRKITELNYNDILSYRKRDLFDLFSKKLEDVLSKTNNENCFNHRVVSKDFRECLKDIPVNSIVYADPPYSNVHYSRFYHAIETLVKYDNPVIEYNGRYRVDRHQSPFDQKRNVKNAFVALFDGVKQAGSHLVLSYSDNGMLSPEESMAIGEEVMGKEYLCQKFEKDYFHMKMGRSDEYKMGVKELLITYKKL